MTTGGPVFPTNPIAGTTYVSSTGQSSVYTGTTWATMASAPVQNNTFSVGYASTSVGGPYINAQNGNVTLSDGKYSFTISELAQFMDTMKKRMLVLTPAFEKHSKYPALKAAYEQYLVVEPMCTGDDDKEE